MEEKIEHLHQILEAAIMAAGEPVNVDKLQHLFAEGYAPSNAEIKEALQEIQASMADRGVELVEVASGYRFQAKADYAQWLKRLWEKKPPRYSRAMLETLALIVYKQPITRGEIEDVRGVAVSSNIMKTLQEHEWVKVVGYRDIPGKPALFASTKKFLDYFNLKSLSDLPALEDIVNLEELEKQMGAQLSLAVEGQEEQAAAEQETLEQMPEQQVIAEQEMPEQMSAEEAEPQAEQASIVELSEMEDMEESASMMSEEDMIPETA